MCRFFCSQEYKHNIGSFSGFFLLLSCPRPFVIPAQAGIQFPFSVMPAEAGIQLFPFLDSASSAEWQPRPIACIKWFRLLVFYGGTPLILPGFIWIWTQELLGSLVHCLFNVFICSQFLSNKTLVQENYDHNSKEWYLPPINGRWTWSKQWLKSTKDKN